MSGDWILVPASDLTAHQLRQAVKELDQELAGGPKDKIAAAIMELLGATDRPPQLDEEKAAARVVALRQMAWDYPIDVVQRACRAWRKVPNYGRWWPAEQDLRAQCEPLFAADRGLRNKAFDLLRQMEAEELAAKQRATEPSFFAGRVHQEFRNRMASCLLPDQMRAYFSLGHIRYIGDREVHVRTPVAEHVLRTRGGHVIEALGVTLRHAPESFLHERDIFEPMTPEEDAEIARKMARLSKALEVGESIKALREAGEL